MKAAVVTEAAERHSRLLEDRTGKPVTCFMFRRPQGAKYTLMLYVEHERASIEEAIRTADRWYVDYNLNSLSYLQLRRDLGYLLRKV